MYINRNNRYTSDFSTLVSQRIKKAGGHLKYINAPIPCVNFFMLVKTGSETCTSLAHSLLEYLRLENLAPESS